MASSRDPVPRDRDNDYTHEAARARAVFAQQQTGASLEHVSSYSFDPALLSGNVESFVGVAQVPIGLAGPLLVHGEHANGEFYVPQDAANVAESSAAFVYAELRDNGDYYYSVTIPSLIVATFGGGTGLPTQRECLELLGCHGKGKVRKFAEIVAATVLCGELSLGSAIVAEEWVEAHDIFGRNR